MWHYDCLAWNRGTQWPSILADPPPWPSLYPGTSRNLRLGRHGRRALGAPDPRTRTRWETHRAEWKTERKLAKNSRRVFRTACWFPVYTVMHLRCLSRTCWRYSCSYTWDAPRCRPGRRWCWGRRWHRCRCRWRCRYRWLHDILSLRNGTKGDVVRWYSTQSAVKLERVVLCFASYREVARRCAPLWLGVLWRSRCRPRLYPANGRKWRNISPLAGSWAALPVGRLYVSWHASFIILLWFIKLS